LSAPAAHPTITDTNPERIELIRYTENVINTYPQGFHNAKSRWDYFADVKSLALPFLIRAIGVERFDKKRLEIQVTDSGKGIAEDILPNLFGRFVTRTFGDENKCGTGLALYIANQMHIVDKYLDIITDRPGEPMYYCATIPC